MQNNSTQKALVAEEAGRQPVVETHDSFRDRLKSFFRHPRRKTQYLVVLVVVILALGLFYFIYSRSSSPSLPASLTYSYSQLESYTLPGDKPGAGLNFKKPVEISFPLYQASTQNLRGFKQLVGSAQFGNKLVNIAELVTISGSYKSPLTDAELATLGNNLQSDPSSSDYKNAVKSAVTFTQNSFKDSSLTITLGRAVPFTNLYIKSNAWQFTVMAKGSGGDAPSQKGILIIAIGRGTYYYFLVTAAVQNWQSNASIFSQVLNSINIDR